MKIFLVLLKIQSYGNYFSNKNLANLGYIFDTDCNIFLQVIIFQKKKINIYYMASSASEQDGSNTVL